MGNNCGQQLATLSGPQESARSLADDILQLTHHLELPVVVVRAGAAIGVFHAVDDIEADGLPEVVAAGTAHLFDGLLLKQTETALQVFDLSNGHRITSKPNR